MDGTNLTKFSVFATHFELHPQKGDAFLHLSPLINRLNRVDFMMSVEDPTVNQGQIVSNFDTKLEQSLQALGATPCPFTLPSLIPQELDFTFSFAGRIVAVEIEKANREKILRDILKCHMYLHAGADFAVIALAANYPHKLGVWNLFDFGVQRLSECETYGFGTSDKLNRILLLGFEQFDAKSGESLSKKTRKRMRDQASGINEP